MVVFSSLYSHSICKLIGSIGNEKVFSVELNMLRKQKNPIGLRWFILLVQVKFD